MQTQDNTCKHRSGWSLSDVSARSKKLALCVNLVSLITFGNIEGRMLWGKLGYRRNLTRPHDILLFCIVLIKYIHICKDFDRPNIQDFFKVNKDWYKSLWIYVSAQKQSSVGALMHYSKEERMICGENLITNCMTWSPTSYHPWKLKKWIYKFILNKVCSF